MAGRVQGEFRGVAFELWSGRGVWFWTLHHPNEVNAIGVAQTHADAVREACMAIESLPETSLIVEPNQVGSAMSYEIAWTMVLVHFALRGRTHQQLNRLGELY